MSETIAYSWEGAIHGALSLSRVNRELLHCLIDIPDLAVTLYTDPPNGAVEPDKSARIVRADRDPRPVQDVYVRHRWPPYFERPSARRYVHAQPWEYGALKRSWVDAVRANVDEVWCWSTFVAAMYIAAGIASERCFVIPHGIDPAVFRPDGERAAVPVDAETFVFTFVGGCIARKGADIALAAYLHAFRSGDPVVLIFKDIGAGDVYANQTGREAILAAARDPAAPRILYSDAVLDDRSLAALYRRADVLLFPYRGEGFGLPALEAMACGTAPIVTAGGATDDFVGAAEGWRLPARRVSLGWELDGEPLAGEGWWLEPELDAVVATMRALVADRAGVAQRGRQAAAAGARHTWAAAAALAAARLRA